MAIQHRRGIYDRFDPTRLVAGEWAVVLSGDTTASDGMAVYLCFAAGTVKRMATYEDMVANITAATSDIIDEVESAYLADISAATTAAANAADAATTGEASRVAAESDRVAAETARASAETARDAAEADRVAAELLRVSAETARAAAELLRSSAESDRSSAETARAAAETARASAETQRVTAETARASAEALRAAAESNRATAETARASAEADRADAEDERAAAEIARVTSQETNDSHQATNDEHQRYNDSMASRNVVYYCTSGEYDSTTLKPTLADGQTGIIYCTPTGDAVDFHREWIWDDTEEDFEPLGGAPAELTLGWHEASTGVYYMAVIEQ